MQSVAVGEVLSLFITTEESSVPVQKNSVFVDEKGIQQDKHYDKDIQRSVLITTIESYQLIEAHNISINSSALGENLLIDYNPYHLLAGSKLFIGTSILEISQPCTLCNHLSVIDKRVPKLLKNDRGIFAKVVKKGEIKEGDKIYLQECSA